MYEAIKTEKVGDLTVEIFPDEATESPREWDNLGTMVFTHGKYDFPKEIEFDFDDYNSWNEVKDAIRKKYGPMLITKVWLYDHSGLSFSTESFYGKLPQGHAEFDSGVIGFMFVTKKDIRKEYGRAGKKEMEKAFAILKSELDIYNSYANGECYRFSVTDADDNLLDGCGGYYDIDGAVEAGMEFAKAEWEEIQKSEATKQRQRLELMGQLPLPLIGVN